MADLQEDVAVMLNLVADGKSVSMLGPYVYEKLGWDRVRADAAARETTKHVAVLTNRIKDSGEQIMSMYPQAAELLTDAETESNDDPTYESIADLQTRRRLLHALLNRGEKYRRPFEKGSFATFSIMGTDDWQDYAATVLQMAELETMLNIEDKLDQLLELLQSEKTEVSSPDDRNA